ncbi:MAG: hypothetical protein KFH98_11830, partial [Gemmatimonadetes bacterium]|nr:hypothetical protein [Gemmatimonadota bacterium]
SAFAHLERGIVQKPWYPIARGPQMFSVTRSGYHYILNGDGSEELYHLSSDPGEQYNPVAEPALDSLLTVVRGATQRIIAEDAARRSVR